MRDHAAVWRWFQIAAGAILIAGNTLSLALIVCFRDPEIRSTAAILLVIGTLLGIPLVIRPLVRWFRRPTDLPLQRSQTAQWFADLALLGAKSGKKRTAKAAHLLCESGVLDATHCQFNQADWKLHEAAEIFGELEDTPNQAHALMELGNCRNAAGDHDAAIAAYKSALEIWEHIADSQRAGNTWRLLNNLSAAYSEKGDLDAAERHCRRALHTAHEPEAQAMCMLNLADIHRKRGEFAHAHEVLAGSLDQLDRSRDESFAFGVFTLAMLHDDQQDVREAEELYKQAQELFEQKLGPHHIEIARLLEKYGALLDRNGRSREAATLMAKAAGIRDTVG